MDKDSEITRLRMMIHDLENKLWQKDFEIAQLKGKIKDLEMKPLERFLAKDKCKDCQDYTINCFIDCEK